MSELETQTEQAIEAQAGVMDFSQLLEEKFEPTSETKSEIESAIHTLAGQALANTNLIKEDSFETIERLISAIDKKMSKQLSLVLHNEEFQELESKWRGLHHLVNNTETSTKLKIRFLNISKKEMHKTLMRFKGTKWDQSPIFKAIYENEYGVAGGSPYSCLIGDYYFDHTAPDVNFLSEMSHIAAAAHAPFISAIKPEIVNMKSWQEINNPRDIAKQFDTPQHATWHSFRDSPDSQYVSLTMPRFLGRLPYGEKTNPTYEFGFEEDVDGTDHNSYSWVNASYAMATNIHRSFSDYGWASQIAGLESGGIVDDLPVHTFDTSDGGIDAKCPTEVSITDRRENEFATAGITSLVHYKGTDYGVFFKASSLRKPVQYDDPEATSNAKLATNLSYMLATSRFAHYLKHIVRNKLGSSVTKDKLQTDLQRWINTYVEPSPGTASERGLAERPLSAAEVTIEEDEETPGYYKARFYLKPHYKLEGMTIGLSLVSRLPSEREGG
jgi:type VI secretion system protein ImpC